MNLETYNIIKSGLERGKNAVEINIDELHSTYGRGNNFFTSKEVEQMEREYDTDLSYIESAIVELEKIKP